MDNDVEDMLSYRRHEDERRRDDGLHDDKTFTNAGLSVGMGAFTFGVSYAMRDDGGYMVEVLRDRRDS